MVQRHREFSQDHSACHYSFQVSDIIHRQDLSRCNGMQENISLLVRSEVQNNTEITLNQFEHKLKKFKINSR